MNTDPVAIVRADAPLADLAVQIRAEHVAAVSAVKKGVEHARSAGELLLRAKKLCEHGQWLPWLEKNLPGVGARQAQKYMRLASRWGELPIAANANSDSHSTIDGALAILAEPEPDRLPKILAEDDRCHMIERANELFRAALNGDLAVEDYGHAVERASKLIGSVHKEGVEGLSLENAHRLSQLADEGVKLARAIGVDALTKLGDCLIAIGGSDPDAPKRDKPKK